MGALTGDQPLGIQGGFRPSTTGGRSQFNNPIGEPTLEARRKLAMIRQAQSGRGGTLLTSGALGDLAVAQQTLLGG